MFSYIPLKVLLAEIFLPALVPIHESGPSENNHCRKADKEKGIQEFYLLAPRPDKHCRDGQAKEDTEF